MEGILQAKSKQLYLLSFGQWVRVIEQGKELLLVVFNGARTTYDSELAERIAPER